MRRQAIDSIATGVFFIADTMMYFFVAVIDIFFPIFVVTILTGASTRYLPYHQRLGIWYCRPENPGFHSLNSRVHLSRYCRVILLLGCKFLLNRPHFVITIECWNHVRSASEVLRSHTASLAYNAYFIWCYEILRTLQGSRTVKNIWFTAPVNPWNIEMLKTYFIGAIERTFYRFTGAITHAGCSENTRKKSL